MIHDPSRSFGPPRERREAPLSEAEAFADRLRPVLQKSERVPPHVTARLYAKVRAGSDKRAGFVERAAVHASLAFVVVGFSLDGSLTPASALAIGAVTVTIGIATAALSTVRHRSR